MKSETKKTTLRKLLPMLAVIAIPVALQNLLTTTGSMVDTVMLATLGEKTVGAVGLCAQFTSLMFSCYWGFVGGGMLFFSQFWGAQDHENIRRSYGITLTAIMSVGILFSLLALLFPEAVMHLYTSSVPISQIGVQYLKIVGFAFPLSIEQVRIPLAAGIVSVVTNCVCNYILIFGKLGLPAMGVRGAALGTVIAAVVNVLVLLAAVKKYHIPYITEIRSHFRWNKALFSQYMTKSMPIIANELGIGIGNMMIAVVLGHQADEAIAATAVFRTLEGVIIAFFSGFSNAATVLVGTCAAP